MPALREYQASAVSRVLTALDAVRGVCLVAPTGSGKTVMAAELVYRFGGVTLWLTHTKELVAQTAERLREAGLRTGVIAAGYLQEPGCVVYVASIQTLVTRGLMPLCDQIIVDEFHHFAAAEWASVLGLYPFTPRVGLTATPERPDRRPLSEVVDELVVAAHYRELTELGHLVPVRLLRPAKELNKGVAMEPARAYLEKGEGRRGFIYCRSVKLAYETAEQLNVAGVPTACVEAKTPDDERAEIIARFKAGKLRVLTNMNTLTEGVDVPESGVCILARSMGHVSTYLQAAGRVLRTAPGKEDALVIDLPGISHRFGAPNENRIYSLEGEAIRRTEDPLRVCLACGYTFEPKADGKCPRCGKSNPRQERKKQRVYNVPLQEYFSGPSTPDWVKRSEMERLRDVAKTRGFSDAWVSANYKAKFMELPEAWSDDGRKRAEFKALVEKAKTSGYAAGWAAHRYKAIYGSFPPRSWQ